MLLVAVALCGDTLVNELAVVVVVVVVVVEVEDDVDLFRMLSTSNFILLLTKYIFSLPTHFSRQDLFFSFSDFCLCLRFIFIKLNICVKYILIRKCCNEQNKTSKPILNEKQKTSNK